MISLTINKIAFEIGPLMIRWYAVLIVGGAAIGTWLAYKEAPYRHLTGDDLIDFVIWAVPSGLVGARFYYVIFNWSYYSKYPNEIIALWNGGGAIYGSLIAGTIVLFIFSYYRMVNPMDILDVAVPAVFLGQSIGRWGNFVNKEAYGKKVENLDWLPSFIQNQMYIDGSYRNPTFLFESFGTLIGFILVIIFRHRLKSILRGEIFGFYLIWYGSIRLIVEGMRTDSLMLGMLRVSQILSLILVLIGFCFIIYRRFKIKNIEFYNLSQGEQK
ncbi:prolipoprotein diacylglyceryl transferase [Lactococcus raffinolactis]|uniref:Phosphatidylglycerol--prolipoprotein diacylglyceryl transferase n=3 Tax=Streptococcaceae TaxID=1300 RepID=A0AAE6YN88_9LACT|nr:MULTISPECIES: prolipoprotein diacylglyceryl transferase [Streptococcaceae]HBZ60564.1 prolipoprotein diacylglyceryl transferase [Lactococcus sp.]ATC62434.1 prolipoprotein diacylglyceryl transferase [Lactococcus raffinolactis]MBW9298201.1 prolipoprotein diacylglyceryl transferase [Lactococcus raffinolactis]MDT2732594.1 prolipoprotein diacylglyceryl transferase [Streptococcus parauberis]PCS09432.1 LcoA [Lactococcus raffinolactis]